MLGGAPGIMKLSQLGEFGLIDRLARRERKSASTVVGIGDDAAVLQMTNDKCQMSNEGKYLLITTDTLVEDIDFKKKRLSFFHLGRKALIANISDISAMGGFPTHALVTLGLPKTTNVHSVDELYRGFDLLARKYKIDIIGGDTTDSAVIFISITLLGEVAKENLLLRSGAKVGDLICVTGEFGGTAAKKYDLRLTPRLRSEQATYNLRLSEAQAIAQSHLATAMIDSSDGLVRSLLEICRASKVGARLWKDQVPIAKGATLRQALYGGEEYELVFTVPKNKLGQLKVKHSIVGKIVEKTRGEKFERAGYEHFK